jgi:hypothetical protein
VSEIVERLIGSYIEPVPSLHPLAEIVEQRLRSDSIVGQFLSALPENPPLTHLKVTSLNEHTAQCSCPVKVKDHESTSYFQTEVKFSVDLATSTCCLPTPAPSS